MSVPTGPIKAVNGLDWSDITRYDDIIHAEADPVGWPIERVRGHIAIESKGDPHAVQRNATNGDSFGLLQVVPYGIGWEGWHELVKEKAGLSRSASRNQVNVALYDPRVNIAVGVAILESFYVQHGTLDKASSAFFTGTPNWGGSDTVNGTTGRQYCDTLNSLIREQEAFKPVDLVSFIVGGKPTNDDYGFKAPTNLPYYEYFNGHGGNEHQHPGIDATATLGQPLFSPINGTVVCGGTGVGGGAWGTGCAAFPDQMGRGAGRVEILADDGKHSLILGHCSRSLVSPGQSVVVGQKVAEAGGMNGWHVHIEAREWNGRDYVILDPRKVFSVGQVTTPAPDDYAPRLPIPQPQDYPNWWTVVAEQDGIPVLQHTGEGAPAVRWPLAKGEEFTAVGVTIGQDNKPWWYSTTGSRIPLVGTRLLGEPLFPAPSTPTEPQPAIDQAIDEVEALRAEVDRRMRQTITTLGGKAA